MVVVQNPGQGQNRPADPHMCWSALYEVILKVAMDTILPFVITIDKSNHGYIIDIGYYIWSNDVLL